MVFFFLNSVRFLIHLLGYVMSIYHMIKLGGGGVGVDMCRFSPGIK